MSEREGVSGICEGNHYKPGIFNLPMLLILALLPLAAEEGILPTRANIGKWHFNAYIRRYFIRFDLNEYPFLI